MTIRTFFIIIIVYILLMLSISLHAESPFRKGYVYFVTSPYHSTTGKGGERRNNLHEGIDLWCPDPIIFPIKPGIVSEIGVDSVFGKFVIIDHGDNLFSLYAHGSKIYNTALPGSIVDCNTPIMRQGSTGYSSGDHLHLSIFSIVDGIRVYEDPEKYIKREDNGRKEKRTMHTL